MINWTAYGFKEIDDDDGIYYHRDDFPLEVWELCGYLCMSISLRSVVKTKNQIKATNKNLELFLKAFHLPLKP